MAPPIRTYDVKPVALSAGTLRNFKAGDAEAFAEVVRAYGPVVRRVVARYWRGVFDQEEAMQEIWVHAFRNRDALDLARGDAFTGWLAVLARRRCIDLLRRADLTRDESEAAAIEWLVAAPAQEDAAEQKELRRAVEDFATKLKSPWREFFRFHFVEGLDYDEVTARMGIGKLRCKYMRKVLAARATKNRALMDALGRATRRGDAS